MLFGKEVSTGCEEEVEAPNSIHKKRMLPRVLHQYMLRPVTGVVELSEQLVVRHKILHRHPLYLSQGQRRPPFGDGLCIQC